jgi:formate-dependent nitrite reductase membrane component NrfD
MSLWNSALEWIEASALGNAIRESGVWTYGVINLVHVVGIATLFGSILILDLRLLGWRRYASLGEIGSLTLPVAAVGFTLAVLSGICMLATNGSEYIGNPFLPIKFIAIGLGVANAVLLSRLAAWKSRGEQSATPRDQVILSIAGGISLACWVSALSAGRMIGYW